jgi:AcrR family transcriptional regulator
LTKKVTDGYIITIGYFFAEKEFCTMASRKEQHAEATRRDIVAAARKLFAEKGFESVTIREIAKEAGCSHTTIYIYFKDKEALLHELSMPPLQSLKQQMETILLQPDWSPEQKLKSVSKEFIRFCLRNRNMYAIFFAVRAVRVDEKEPELEINKIRNALFGLLQKALQECMRLQPDDDLLLMCARIYFFTLHGIVGTYAHSEEPLEALLHRLSDTFDEAMEVLLAGFRHRLNTGVNRG